MRNKFAIFLDTAEYYLDKILAVLVRVWAAFLLLATMYGILWIITYDGWVVGCK